MRVKRVEWSRKALGDIADSADWYAVQGGLALGERFLFQVQATCSQLSQFPGSGSLRHADCIPGLPAPLRFLPLREFERHLVYYIDLPTHIQVIRVWNSTRGLAALMEKGTRDP